MCIFQKWQRGFLLEEDGGMYGIFLIWVVGFEKWGGGIDGRFDGEIDMFFNLPLLFLVDLGSGDVWSLWFTLDLCVHMIERFLSLADFLHEKNESGLWGN